MRERGNYSRKHFLTFALLGILGLATIGIIIWIIAISVGSTTEPHPQSVSELIKLHESRIHDLEVQMSQCFNQQERKEEEKAAIPMFAARKIGDGAIYSGEITYNETLYSVPSHAFSEVFGTFYTPLAGYYMFSFSGTSFCGENMVEVKVNDEVVLLYADRAVTWSGVNGTGTFGFLRGWTQQFALQLEVGDTVKLFADCESTESHWENHFPGSVKEHQGHKCFYYNFYFFGHFVKYNNARFSYGLLSS